MHTQFYLFITSNILIYVTSFDRDHRPARAATSALSSTRSNNLSPRNNFTYYIIIMLLNNLPSVWCPVWIGICFCAQNRKTNLRPRYTLLFNSQLLTTALTWAHMVNAVLPASRRRVSAFLYSVLVLRALKALDDFGRLWRSCHRFVRFDSRALNENIDRKIPLDFLE